MKRSTMVWMLAVATACGDDGASSGSDASVSGDAAAPAQGLIFASDWSTATGTTAAALSDSSSATPWAETTGLNQLEVVPAASLDFPSTMTNAMRVDYAAGDSAEVRCFDCWQAPSIGGSMYYRWYFRFSVPASYGDLSIGPHHPFAARFGQCPFEWELKFGSRADGSLEVFIPFYESNVIAVPPGRLANDATYRLELGFHRTAATTYKVDVRIFEAAGGLLWDDDDFAIEERPGETLASADPDITISLDTCMQSLQLGSNGPGADWTVIAPGDAFLYIGGVAASRADWIGPYVAGETASAQ